MIPRYEDARISAIWTDEAKLARWDKVEDAVIGARRLLGLIDPDDAAGLERIKDEPIDVAAWHERETQTGHDLAAYVELRWEGLPMHLRRHFHDGMTSYDTEDPAFVLSLQESSSIVHDALFALFEEMLGVAKRYRYQPMLDRTHGQHAKLASFGSRILMWRAELIEADHALIDAQNACMRSRISGAIGTYGGRLTPQIEREALQSLGLMPFYGAGQITPRTLYARIAQALELVAVALAKIAVDFQLGARSGNPLWHEPFGKRQKGSSAMPHKKNPITMEQTEGLAELARGLTAAIVGTAKTKERRDIAQSCVERTAWPDLFHTLMRMIGNVRRVLGGMEAYPDHMLREIIDSQGTFASEDAKAFLAERLAKRGVGAETVYRIIQVACWNAFPRSMPRWMQNDGILPSDLGTAQGWLEAMASDNKAWLPDPLPESIERLIAQGRLTSEPKLHFTAGEVASWNTLLREVFSTDTVQSKWYELFTIPYQLQGEAHLFDVFNS